MNHPESIREFINWIQTFKYEIYSSLDDIRQKFILPMFEYLHYSDKYQRHQYGLTIHNSDNEVINSEIDYIYFATDNVEEQNLDTSLILVQIQGLSETNLTQTVEKTKLYSIHLQPLFFIVTNGSDIKVFQRLSNHWHELLFDITLYELQDPKLAMKFYERLNFHHLKFINKKNINPLIHGKYSLIEKSLEQYLISQKVLTTNDKTTFSRTNEKLIIVKPKVSIECNLPEALGKGSCVIEFSYLGLRGLRVNLNHTDILKLLITGIHTQPDWECRSFLKKIDNQNFQVHLGQTTLILSDLETVDLCLCIDAVGQEYENKIREFENSLETWDFEFIDLAEIRGFHLFSVESTLWELMLRFAQEFNYAQGKSEWHIFHQENQTIRVSRGIRDHAFILPKFDYNWSGFSQVHIIYEINEVHLQSLEKGKITSWEQNIGTRGTWTAKYTKKWLLEKFIPQVINYYLHESPLSEVGWFSKISIYQSERIAISEINDIKNLIPYLRDIQSWLHKYPENIASVILHPYYQAFTNLVRNTDSAINGMDYIMGNLQRMEWRNTKEKMNTNYNWTFKDALVGLDAQVVRVNNCVFEKSLKADLMTRTFIWIIEHGKISFSQSQMNAAKQTLLPLWEQSRFQTRHVYRYRYH